MKSSKNKKAMPMSLSIYEAAPTPFFANISTSDISRVVGAIPGLSAENPLLGAMQTSTRPSGTHKECFFVLTVKNIYLVALPEDPAQSVWVLHHDPAALRTRTMGMMKDSFTLHATPPFDFQGPLRISASYALFVLLWEAGQHPPVLRCLTLIAYALKAALFDVATTYLLFVQRNVALSASPAESLMIRTAQSALYMRQLKRVQARTILAEALSLGVPASPSWVTWLSGLRIDQPLLQPIVQTAFLCAGIHHGSALTIATTTPSGDVGADLVVAFCTATRELIAGAIQSACNAYRALAAGAGAEQRRILNGWVCDAPPVVELLEIFANLMGETRDLTHEDTDSQRQIAARRSGRSRTVKTMILFAAGNLLDKHGHTVEAASLYAATLQSDPFFLEAHQALLFCISRAPTHTPPPNLAAWRNGALLYAGRAWIDALEAPLPTHTALPGGPVYTSGAYSVGAREQFRTSNWDMTQKLRSRSDEHASQGFMAWALMQYGKAAPRLDTKFMRELELWLNKLRADIETPWRVILTDQADGPHIFPAQGLILLPGYLFSGDSPRLLSLIEQEVLIAQAAFLYAEGARYSPLSEVIFEDDVVSGLLACERPYAQEEGRLWSLIDQSLQQRKVHQPHVLTGVLSPQETLRALHALACASDRFALQVGFTAQDIAGAILGASARLSPHRELLRREGVKGLQQLWESDLKHWDLLTQLTLARLWELMKFSFT